VKTSHLKKIALLFSFFPVLLCCTWGCGETKPATSSQSVPANAAPLLEQARQLKDAARYTEALAALDKAHQADPKNVDVCLMQAELHAMSSHLSDALQSARNAHQAAPDDSRATLALLRYTPPYLASKETEALAQTAVKQQPQSSEAHYFLGKALADSGDAKRTGDAAKAFAESVRLAPANPLPLLEQGKLYLEADRPKDAVTALEKAWSLLEQYLQRGGMPFLELAQQRRNAAYWLAQAYRRAGQAVKAADFSARTARYSQKLEEYQTLVARASANPPDESARTKLAAMQKQK
jgi:tetratricopeptide (TPR) repeat protein